MRIEQAIERGTEHPAAGEGLMGSFLRSFPRATTAAATVALTYLTVSVIWVIFSDRLVLLLAGTVDVQRLTRLQTLKGWGFVLLSSVGLFLLVRGVAASIERAQRRAEAANHIKDQFLAVLSHEMRTPLTPALLNASALRTDPRLPPDVRETAAEIASQITAEARIIDDLLDVSGIASGTLRIERQPVDAHAVIHRVVETMRPSAAAKSLDLVLRLDAAERVVAGDPARLEQVLRAVIGNAVKFTPDGGAVTIGTHSRGRDLRIQVADTGIGISSEVLPRLFHPFEQADRTINRQHGGLGLGLSLCRHLLKLHDGSIDAHSEGIGKGARFEIRLPLMPVPANRAPAVSSPGAAGGLRILAVEDDKETRNALAAVLRGMGHEVTTAGSLTDAQRIIHNNGRVDLLITDIDLPDGDGRDLLKPARLRHGTMGITVSGFGGADDVARSLAAGFNSHLVKPFTPEQIRLAVQHCAQLLQPA